MQTQKFLISNACIGYFLLPFYFQLIYFYVQSMFLITKLQLIFAFLIHSEKLSLVISILSIFTFNIIIDVWNSLDYVFSVSAFSFFLCSFFLAYFWVKWIYFVVHLVSSTDFLAICDFFIVAVEVKVCTGNLSQLPLSNTNSWKSFKSFNSIIIFSSHSLQLFCHVFYF